MFSTHSRFSYVRTSRQGFSLIEVAIALVIFVIGALAIIRIFPGALSVIGNNGDQQIATNLNRSVAARLQSEGAVPYANFNVAVNTDGSIQWSTADDTDHTRDFVNATRPTSGDIDASVVGVPRFNNTLPSPDDINKQTNNSALSRFRGIQGEKVEITTLSEGTPPTAIDVKYVFTQFPISYSAINLTAGDQILLPTLSQEYTLQNARIDKAGNVTFTNATFVDSDGKTVRLDDAADATAGARRTVPANSMVYASYRYYNTDGQVWAIRDEPLPIPTAVTNLTDPTFSLTVSPPTTTRGARAAYDTTLPNTTGAVAELIDVRVKRYVGVGAFGGPNDPAFAAPGYPNINQVGDARRGMIRLDPTLTDNSPVFVDYIADWSLLMQQGVPLTTSTAATTTDNYKQLALGAPFIEDQAPVAMYSLLLDRNPAYVPPHPPNKPFPYRSQFGTSEVVPNAGNKLLAPNEDELRAGKATFNVTDEVRLARVAYRTRDSWVQQLSVAAKAYKPYALRTLTGAGSTVTEPWRDYFLGADNYLYFHAGEAGKTISISYSVTDLDSAGNTIIRNFVDRPFVIDATLVQVPNNFYNGLGARLKLTRANGDTLPDNTTGFPNLVSIQAVKGSSITVRTAYINGSKYAQTLLTSNRGANP